MRSIAQGPASQSVSRRTRRTRRAVPASMQSERGASAARNSEWSAMKGV